MTLKAAGEFFVHCLSMGFSMTFLALWNLAMSNMTGRTLQFTVFGVIGLEVVKNLSMTCATNVIRCFFRIFADILCTVWAVANKAVCIHLTFNMRFMTVKASGKHTMFVGMTSSTPNFYIVFTGKGLELLPLGVIMAYFTGNHIFTLLVSDHLLYA